MPCAVEQAARLAQTLGANSAELAVVVAACNAVAAPVVAELDAAELVEHRSAVAFELVAAVVFAGAQRVAEEHPPSAVVESGGLAGPRQSVELAAQVSGLPAIAGRIDVPLARRSLDRHSRADEMAELVSPADANSRKCA